MVSPKRPNFLPSDFLVSRSWASGQWGLRAHPALAFVHPGGLTSLVSLPSKKPQDGWIQKTSPCQLQAMLVVERTRDGYRDGVGSSKDQS